MARSKREGRLTDPRTQYRETVRPWSELLLGVGARSVIGIGFGVAGSIAGYFIGWLFLGSSVSLSAAVVILTTGTGIGGGAVGFLGWVKLDDGPLANVPVLGLALAGGLTGAWGGLLFARAAYGMDIKTPDARITAVAAAALTANLMPALYAIAERALRRDG